MQFKFVKGLSEKILQSTACIFCQPKVNLEVLKINLWNIYSQNSRHLWFDTVNCFPARSGEDLSYRSRAFSGLASGQGMLPQLLVGPMFRTVYQCPEVHASYVSTWELEQADHDFKAKLKRWSMDSKKIKMRQVPSQITGWEEIINTHPHLGRHTQAHDRPPQ